MCKIFTKFVPRVLREDQKERRCHDSREMVELINSDPAVLDALMTCDESWIYCFDPETKRQSSQWQHAGSPWSKKARPIKGCSGRDSVGRGQHSSNRVSGISTRTIHQSTTSSLSQTIWARWASRHTHTLSIVPVTFGYSLSSRKTLEAVVMRQLRRWKRLWWRSLTRS